MLRTKLVGIICIVAGALMLVAGAVTWGVASSQLAAESITVPSDSQFLGGYFAGKQVTGPLSAYAQADIINTHAMAASDGKTFAELGALARDAEAAGNAELAEQYTQTRATVQTASFLRASLFTSIIAFGVAALVMGLGLLSGLIGWALLGLRPTSIVEAPEAAEASEAA